MSRLPKPESSYYSAGRTGFPATYAGGGIGAHVQASGETASVPIVCHIDHATSLEECVAGINHGFSSVMIDGSRLNLDENIARTATVVEYARRHGASVEGEIGFVDYDFGEGRK